MQQKFGPKRCLYFCCIPYLVSWLLTAFATNYYMIYAARILVGVSYAIISTSVYTVEVTSTEMRASFSLLVSSSRSLGTVIVSTMGLFVRWKTIAWFCMGFPVLTAVACFLTPESPFYLVAKKREEEAEKSFSRLYGPKYPSVEKVKELRRNLDAIQQGRSRKMAYIKKIGKHPEIYKPFLIITLLTVVQQFSGATVIRGYVVKIFDEVFRDETNSMEHIRVVNCSDPDTINRTSKLAYVSAITVAMFRMVASLFLARLLLKFRRRVMYFISTALTVIGLTFFAIFTYLSEHSQQSAYKWLSLTTTCFIVFSVQLGVQTIPFMLSGELFPTDIRAMCKSFSRFWTTVLLMMLLKTYPYVEASLSLTGTFSLFAVALVAFFPIVYMVLPETKDLSLEEIQATFKRKSIENKPADTDTVDVERCDSGFEDVRLSDDERTDNGEESHDSDLDEIHSHGDSNLDPITREESSIDERSSEGSNLDMRSEKDSISDVTSHEDLDTDHKSSEGSNLDLISYGNLNPDTVENTDIDTSHKKI